MSILKRTQQWATFARTWHIYDCTWQNPFDSAKVIKSHLMGLHKPIYHPMNDCGDHVVLINTGEIALPGDEWIKRVYFHHTGYPGGASWTLAWQLHEKDPTMVMKKAVYSAMKGNLQRRHTMQRLHLFPDDKVPEEILANVTNQIKQTRVVPKRLDHIGKETLENFPAIMDYPKDYVLRSDCDPVFAGVEAKKKTTKPNSRKMGRLGKVDPSSFAEVEKITTVHSDLKWKVDFEAKKIVGSVVHKFNVLEKNLPAIFLDVSEINVIDASVVTKSGEIPINFFISDNVQDIGSKLTLELPQGTNVGELIIKINYETASSASALQWLTKEQTLGKEHPYLFSQCQAIHARSIIPCQDSPSVKFTYNAVVEHPKELTALMSAIIKSSENGTTTFEQTIPIPAYLLAIAIGKLVSRPLGPNSNVWAEEGIIEDCAFEFSETSHMLKTAEEICGPYVWKQYDLLVMPPSFPFGGMENPCLTFVTPTLLAGDKSLADVVAHEIAHSWTGNFVTNRNFEHFWLNEGFTVFVENKIVGRLHGAKEKAFHSIRNITDLQECLRTQLSNTPELTKLVVDLSNCGPDDAFSSVPYIKGSTFLQYIEETLGGPEVFEPFLRSYLKKYAYKSILTNDFKETLYEYFSTTAEDKLNKIDWDKWLFSEGMPPIIPHHDDTLAVVCKHLSELWSSKTTAELEKIPEISNQLSAHQLIDFLGKLIESSEIVDLNEAKINLLEKTYSLNATKNAEIRFRFLRLCIRARLIGRINEIIEFANSNFRMKFVRPVYRDLAGWPEGKPIAVENFLKIKDQMMKVCQYTVEKDLGLQA